MTLGEFLTTYQVTVTWEFLPMDYPLGLVTLTWPGGGTYSGPFTWSSPKPTTAEGILWPLADQCALLDGLPSYAAYREIDPDTADVPGVWQTYNLLILQRKRIHRAMGEAMYAAFCAIAQEGRP